MSLLESPAMTDANTKPDPFKPEQPRIPGVAEARVFEKSARPTAAAQPAAPPGLLPYHMPPVWLALSLLGALFLGIGIAWWSHGTSAKESFPAAAGDPPAAAPEPVKPVEKLAVAPGEVATTEELSKPWSSKRFIYRDPVTHAEVPATVVRLPGGAYWGFSLREPFGTCEMEFVTDLNRLATMYNYRTDHPMVGDPCNRTVFDLLRYGNNPDGLLVRGAIAQGAAVRPPIAIEIRERGKQIVAVKME
jgi:hypothetical protein